VDVKNKTPVRAKSRATGIRRDAQRAREDRADIAVSEKRLRTEKRIPLEKILAEHGRAVNR